MQQILLIFMHCNEKQTQYSTINLILYSKHITLEQTAQIATKHNKHDLFNKTIQYNTNMHSLIKFFAVGMNSTILLMICVFATHTLQQTQLKLQHKQQKQLNLQQTQLKLQHIKQENKQKYLNLLLQRQFQIQQTVNQLKKIAENAQRNINLSKQQQIQQKIRLQAIKDQQQLILQAYPHTFLPTCPQLTIQQQQRLSLSAQNTSKNIHTINASKQYKTNIPNQQGETEDSNINHSCPFYQQLNNYQHFYQLSLQGISQQIGINCSQQSSSDSFFNAFIATGSSFYYPNLSTTAPWVYGNLTQKQFNQKVFNLKSLYQAVECPQNTPFLSVQNLCFACSQRVYQISTKQCIQCPTGTAYSSSSHSCSAASVKWRSNNAAADNFVGSSAQDDGQTCNQRQPFYDGKNCMSCALPLYFNLSSQQCLECPPNQIFTINQKKCKNKTVYYTSNLKNSLNFIGYQVSPSPLAKTLPCPENAPYSNGSTCSVCQLPQFYDLLTFNCRSCPQGFQFDTTVKRCQWRGQGGKLNSNLMSTRNFIGKVPVYASLWTDCPRERSYFDGHQCLACELPNYFNFDSVSCQACKSGRSFSTVMQKCQFLQKDYFTDPKAKNIYFNGVFDSVLEMIEATKKGNPKAKQCQPNRPFYNGELNQCINCAREQPLFDIKNNKCIGCGSESEFDEASHICLTHSVSVTLERMMMNTS